MSLRGKLSDLFSGDKGRDDVQEHEYFIGMSEFHEVVDHISLKNSTTGSTRDMIKLDDGQYFPYASYSIISVGDMVYYTEDNKKFIQCDVEEFTKTRVGNKDVVEATLIHDEEHISVTDATRVRKIYKKMDPDSSDTPEYAVRLKCYCNVEDGCRCHIGFE